MFLTKAAPTEEIPAIVWLSIPHPTVVRYLARPWGCYSGFVFPVSPPVFVLTIV